MRIEKTVDRGSKEKLYVQIYSILIGKIESGEWPPGAQIPTEDELCRTYDVSKVTVREAIQELVREGYLFRQQGRGTFVTYSLPQVGIVMRTRITDEIYGEGVKVRKEIIERGVREAPEDVKQLLKTDDPIHCVVFKRLVDDEPSIEKVFIPAFILPGVEEADIVSRSLYDLIEEKGTKKISRILQTMEATELRKDVADVMGMKEGKPAVLIGRTLIGSDGIPVAHTRVIGCGSKHRFQMEFDRIK
ncbi:MAG: GntR family transcriptional regulator [Nitrospirota bacterium]